MIHNDAFASLPNLLNVLQAHTGTKSRLFLGAAASAVALKIILKQLAVKQPKLITEYTKVARELNNNGLEFDEWDFIIVGGGAIYFSTARVPREPDLVQAQRDVFWHHVYPKTRTCGFYLLRLVEGQCLAWFLMVA
jgi:choline dehydrogenase